MWMVVPVGRSVFASSMAWMSRSAFGAISSGEGFRSCCRIRPWGMSNIAFGPIQHPSARIDVHFMFMLSCFILAGMDEIRRKALKGRGAISNESSRFERERRVLVDDG